MWNFRYKGPNAERIKELREQIQIRKCIHALTNIGNFSDDFWDGRAWRKVHFIAKECTKECGYSKRVYV